MITVIIIQFGMVYYSLWMNHWNGNVMDALSNKALARFLSLTLTFSIISVVYVLVMVINEYLQGAIKILWRTWLTENYLNRWMSDNQYYYLERYGEMDNPDQRISEDMRLFVENSLQLFFSAINMITSIISFTGLLWTLSGNLVLPVFGQSFTVPGYMVWLAYGWAILSSWLVAKVGKPLIRVTVMQQRVEADFRYLLVNIRNNAEQIAFYRGAGQEEFRLNHTFLAVRQNWWQLLNFTARVGFVNSFFGQLAGVLPTLLAAPAYFTGHVTLGGMIQLGGAFTALNGALSWFMQAYASIITWIATARRIKELHDATSQPPLSPIALRKHDDTNIVVATGLTLNLPDGSKLADLGEIHIKPGERWLIRGPSGSGKSTLLRALAGLWFWGTGEVSYPAHYRVMFISQQNYLPAGTLKDSLCYPDDPNNIPDAVCLSVLTQCRLGHYSHSLHDQSNWGQRLSPGEQQRLSFARVLLNRPDFIFMDEVTSALDEDNEQYLFQQLMQTLPASALISVAHRPGLMHFHQHFLDMPPVHSAGNASQTTTSASHPSVTS